MSKSSTKDSHIKAYIERLDKSSKFYKRLLENPNGEVHIEVIRGNLEKKTMEEANRDKNTAAIIAVLFGCTGLHWVYLKRRVLTIIFMIMDFVILEIGVLELFIPLAIIGIINGIRIWSMNWNSFNNKYNRKN
jgi:hypothetical protein